MESRGACEHAEELIEQRQYPGRSQSFCEPGVTAQIREQHRRARRPDDRRTHAAFDRYGSCGAQFWRPVVHLETTPCYAGCGRCGIDSPLTTAGRARNAVRTRITCAK